MELSAADALVWLAPSFWHDRGRDRGPVVVSGCFLSHDGDVDDDGHTAVFLYPLALACTHGTRLSYSRFGRGFRS